MYFNTFYLIWHALQSSDECRVTLQSVVICSSAQEIGEMSAWVNASHLLVKSTPKKHWTLKQPWHNADPPSATLGQH